MRRFFKRRKEQDVQAEEFDPISVDKALKEYAKSRREAEKVKGAQAGVTEEDVLKQTEDGLCQIVEMERELEDAKREYEAVTLYLADIQKIDAMTMKQKEGIIDASRKIIQLNKERNRYKKTEKGISEAQYAYIERFAREIQKELPIMKEQEAYQELIKSDLRQLEGEKGALIYEKEAALDKKDFLKKFSIASCLVVFVAFMTLFLVMEQTGANLMVPFFITGVMAAAAILYILVESRNSTYQLKVSEMKLNRAITLSNKIKVKYVNCTSALDYAYEKYRVNSYQELQFLWVEYVKAKDEAKLYQQNTEMMNFYQQVIVEELMNYGIEDAAIWIHQPDAFLDAKEMVEVRHRLNVRRQKLRERIDYNNRQRAVILSEIESFKKRFPSKSPSIHALASNYRVLI
ncbi:MAG: hypothetical protein E7256_01460 [Lachnospiraceae bacterium]|nr:hypothetical protein [Lachnospiraceae bacterium]